MPGSRIQLAVVFVLLLFGTLARGAEIKLYLKDGNYHIVREYEIRGSRVRFYSLERSAWEELPRQLVDFEATDRAQEEEKLKREEDFQDAIQLAQERPTIVAGRGFEIAPGVILPPGQGVFLFDGHRVMRLLQTQATVSGDKKRGILAAIVPGKGRRSFVELPEPQAAMRTLNPSPVFYLHFSEDPPPDLILIELTSRKKTRRVEVVTVGAFGGKPKENRRPLPVKTGKVGEALYKMEPTEPLPAGEYAVAEILAEGQLNFGIWDFGVEKAITSDPD